MSKSHSPIRIDKIEETKQMLEKNDCFPTTTILQKINYIFINRKKHFDREEEEKGLSVKEIGLILFPKSVTIDDMLARNDTAVRVITNTKRYIMKFKKWDGNNEINLYSLRSKNGEYFYYNIQNDKDMQNITLKKAKVYLGLSKTRQKFKDFLSLPLKEQEEIRKKDLEKMEKIQIKNMRKKKTWDGKPVYQDIDFIEINLIDLLTKNQK